MSILLTEYAKSHIWVDPKQNLHQRIKPSRISRDLGATNYIQVMRDQVDLPVTDQSFHVYALGRYDVSGLGFSMTNNTWYALDELQHSTGVLIDVVADNGVMIPPKYAYLYSSDNHYLILSVARDKLNLGTDVIKNSYGESVAVEYSLDLHGLSVRFYANAVAKTNSWKNTAPVPDAPLSFVTTYIESSSDYQTFMSAVDNLIGFYNGVGLGQYFLDGFLITRPLAFEQGYKGSTLYFRYDETLKDTRDFKVTDCPAFRSRLDVDADKYLLHSKVNTDGVDYVQDCDFWIGYLDTNGVFKGVQIDPYGQVFIRQVTNNSWSVAHTGVTNATAYHPWLADRVDLTFRVYVRTPAMSRGVGQQKNRITDLYRLTYDDQLKVMSGVDSTMSLWQAANLEASSYIQLLGASYKDITLDLVEDVFGYHPIAKALAKSIYIVQGGSFTVDEGMAIPSDVYAENTSNQAQRVIFWYDRQGVLLGYSEDNTSEVLILVPDEYIGASLAEVVLGQLVTGVSELETYQGMTNVTDPYNGYYGHRNYLVDKNSATGAWTDVTGTNYATYVPKTDQANAYVAWDSARLTTENYIGITRFASMINVHTPTFTKANFTGVFETSLMRIDQGQLQTYGPAIGTPTVYMDGKTLLDGLDYVCLPTGRIIIYKRPTTEVSNCQVIIRCQGYTDPNTNAPFKPLDLGVVKGGVLSHNQIYNATANKEVKCVVDGRVYHRSQVLMAEGGDENLTGQLISDGYSYGVLDTLSLIEPFSDLSTIDAKVISSNYDQQVQGYLSSRLDDVDPENSYIERERHQLYSPVMSFFIAQCLNQTITDDDADKEASTGSMLTRYKTMAADYLAIDPLLNGVDLNYVDVAPHPYLTSVSVSEKQYAFLQRVNRTLLKSTLDLSSYLTINVG